MMELQTPIEELTRVGKTTASRLHRMGIYTARDLLFHIPHRYEDWSQAGSIAQIKPFTNTSIIGEVVSIKNFKSSRRRMQITEAIIKDETASLKVIWFNQAFLKKNLPPGTRISLSGKAEQQGREIIFKSPKYEILANDQEPKHTNRLLPIYPLSLNLTQKQIAFLVNLVLPLSNEISDPLPEILRNKYNLPDIKTALKIIHTPIKLNEVQKASRRFAFEEIFYLQLQSYLIRESNQVYKSQNLKFHEAEIVNFVKALPFELTADQKKSAWQIFLDTKEDKSMNRLLQGDVGSGKTVVAAMAMYNAALNQAQSVLMAPTEVLATQHWLNFVELFKPLDLNLGILTRTQQFVAHQGQVKEVSKKDLLKQISGGRVAMAIGTHALIQKDVRFANLALAVIDEQHRFGVAQRKVLRTHSGDARTVPHLLSMTATPIPRTLSLVFYGDLSISSLREMPKDRLKIKTKVVKDGQRKQMYDFIRDEVGKGHQAYVVCPLIEESDKLGVTSVSEEATKLAKVFPKLKLEILHGKLSSDEKISIMAKFKKGEINILIATTVIEVGVDVANATLMLIEGAERFGLSQLHQIRGRVGRGKEQSYCFLCPSAGSYESVARLDRFIKCRDGFEVSELDLQMRGSGEMLGTRQSGVLELRFADMQDTRFVEEVNMATKEFLKQNNLDDFPLLKQHIEALNKKVHLE